MLLAGLLQGEPSGSASTPATLSTSSPRSLPPGPGRCSFSHRVAGLSVGSLGDWCPAAGSHPCPHTGHVEWAHLGHAGHQLVNLHFLSTWKLGGLAELTEQFQKARPPLCGPQVVGIPEHQLQHLWGSGAGRKTAGPRWHCVQGALSLTRDLQLKLLLGCTAWPPEHRAHWLRPGAAVGRWARLDGALSAAAGMGLAARASAVAWGTPPNAVSQLHLSGILFEKE